MVLSSIGSRRLNNRIERSGMMWEVFLLLFSCLMVIDGSSPVRGVPPSRSAFYARAKEFQCLDGTRRIPYEQVNDDYCDCQDGSDEPGTSACSNSYFYCANKLHEPQMLISSRVNDQLCDCCDGSDEYDGSVKCENTCEEIGRSARLAKEQRLIRQKAGWEKRKELSKEGLVMKKEMEASLVTLKEEKEKLEPSRTEAEELLNTAEDKERELKNEREKKTGELRAAKKREVATILFESIDVDKNGKITKDELKATLYIDANGNGEIEEDEIKIYLNEEGEADIEHFETHSFYNLRRLKREKIEAEKREKEAKEGKEKEGEGEDTKIEKHDGDEDEDIDEEELNEVVDELDENIDLPPISDEEKKLGEETNAARQKVDEIKRQISDIDNKIRDAEVFGTLDFGEDFAWASLKGKCVEANVGEYTYKLCPFDRCTQKDKNGHGETNLGTWKEWRNRYTEMLFNDGQTCWNGPARSTVVQVECGDEESLVEVDEPGRCEYRMVYRTAAACEDPAKNVQVHSEL